MAVAVSSRTGRSATGVSTLAFSAVADSRVGAGEAGAGAGAGVLAWEGARCLAGEAGGFSLDSSALRALLCEACAARRAEVADSDGMSTSAMRSFFTSRFTYNERVRRF